MEREDLKELLKTVDKVLQLMDVPKNKAAAGDNFNTQWNMWREEYGKYQELKTKLLAEPPLPESTATVSDWEKLRDKYFKECTDEETYDFRDSLPKVIMAPHDLFEWFNQNIITPQAPKEDVGEKIFSNILNSVTENRNHLRQLLIDEKAITAMLQKEIDELRQAPKEVREVYLPVSVEEKPLKDDWYTMVVDGGLNYNCWYDSEGGWVIPERAKAYKTWLKKVSLSLPKGECISQDDLVKELEDKRIVNLMKEFDEKLPEEEKWKQPCQNIYYLSLKHTAEYLLDKFSVSLPIKEIEENAEHWKGEAEHWFEEAHRLAKIIEGKEIEGK